MKKQNQNGYKFGLFNFTIAIFFFTIVLSNCTKTNVDNPNPIDQSSTEQSSFSLIQDKILTPSCATSGCHSSTSDASFNQHGLVLAAGKSYKNLFGITPKNQQAITDNLKLITAFKSAESLLFHKLNWSNAHHSPKYLSPMPLGGKSLFVGQIEFIRRWIEAGAPEKGNVVDATLLNDKTEASTEDTTFTALAKPNAGEGFQLKVEKFEVAPNFERELYVRKEIGNKSEIYINKYSLKSRSNSHHMVIYDFKNQLLLPNLNEVRDLRNPNNTLNLLTAISTANHIFLGGGSDSQAEYSFPEGTALLLPPNASVDLNPHYFNKTNQVHYGENYVNFYTTTKAKVKNVVQMLNLSNEAISILPGERKTFTKSWTFTVPNNVVMLTSHTHKLAEKYVIKIKGGPRDGQIVYETTDWEHPTVKNFTTPLELAKGEGLTSEVTYNNNTKNTVKFGLTSEDEMDIIFGYYYEVK
jgi:Copper type II ascorbate-dependent monooxygenase, C-terminal domain